MSESLNVAHMPQGAKVDPKPIDYLLAAGILWNQRRRWDAERYEHIVRMLTWVPQRKENT